MIAVSIAIIAKNINPWVSREVVSRSICLVLLSKQTLNLAGSLNWVNGIDLGESVAQIMYPKEKASEDEAFHRQYILSHGSFYPGEKRAHYGPQWSPPISQETDVLNRLNGEGSRVKESLYWKEEREQ